MAAAQLDWIETQLSALTPGKQWLQHAPSQDARKQTPQRDQTAHYDID
jgi:hypothetical protein